MIPAFLWLAIVLSAMGTFCGLILSASTLGFVAGLICLLAALLLATMALEI